MIDFRSDTVTKPTNEMRNAARGAKVGDAKRGDDPTVDRLERRVTDLLEMDDALFFPSGTMGNQVSCQVHSEYGQEVLVEEESHVYISEYCGLSRHSGLQPRPIDGGERGIPTSDQVQAGIRANSKSKTGLLVLENTHNRKGGLAISPKRLTEAAKPAHEQNVPVHLDGARLFNAAVALDQPLESFTKHVDSVMISVSKGLGAPIGSLVAGKRQFIVEAERTRNAFGGGMRQAGIVAAPALTALEHLEQLEDDHINAETFANGLEEIDGLEVRTPETNIVLVEVSETGVNANRFCSVLDETGVLASEFDEYVVRFCTHRGIESEDVEKAVRTIKRVVSDVN